MKAACEGYYALGQGCEFRMVRRTDETVWEYSANVKGMAPGSAVPTIETETNSTADPG